MTEIVENLFKTKEGYNKCDDCQSVLSPAAYFVKLMETIEQYVTQPDEKLKLKSRRPDLMEMKLDCDNTNKLKLYLEIVNEIIEKKLEKDFGPNALKALATAKYPFNLPVNIYLMSIRAYLKKYNISLADIYKTLIPDSDTGAELLGLSPEEYKLITLPVNQQSELKELCGIPSDKSLDDLKNVDKFNDYTGTCSDRLQLILDKYGEETTISNSDMKVLLDAIGSDRLQLLLNIYSNADKDLDRLKLLLDDIGQSKLQLLLKEYSEKIGVNFDELELLLNSYVKESGINNNTLEKLIENYNQEKENSDEKKGEKISLKYLLDSYEKFKNWILKSLLDNRKKGGKDHLELLVKIYRRATNEVRSKLHKLLNAYSKGNGVNRDRLKLLIDGIDHSKLKLIFDFYGDKSYGALQDDNEKPDLKLAYNKFKEFTTKSLLNAYNKVKNLADEEKLSVNGEGTINFSNFIPLCFLHRFIRLSSKLNWSYDDLAKTLVAIGKKDIDNDVIKKIAQIKSFENRFHNIKQPLNEILGFYSAGIPNDAYDVITDLNSSNQSINEIKQFKKFLSLAPQAYPNKKELYNLLDDLDKSEDEVVEDILSPEDNKIVTSQSAAEDHLKASYKVDSWKQLKDVSKFAESSGIEASKLQSLLDTHNKKDDLKKINSLRVSCTNIATAGIHDDHSIQKDRCNTITDKNSVYEVRKNVVIGDKTIFFYGNKDSSRYSSKVDIYDSKSGEWKKDIPNASELRENTVVAVIGDKAIFFGGRKGISTASEKIDIYDAKNGTWKESIDSTSEPRENAAVAVIGDKAIFFGGRKDNNEYSSKIDIYNAANEKLEDVSASIEPRENAAVAVIDNKAIFFGGTKGKNQYSAKIDIYDTTNREWEEAILPHNNEARASVTVAVIGKKAIFFGGRKGENQYSSQVDIYDISETDPQKRWKTHTISEARENAAVAVIGNKVIFLGGTKGKDQYSSKVDIYDISETNYEKSWTTHTVSEARENAAVVVVGKKAIFFSGKKDQDQYSSKVDIYDDFEDGKWNSFDIGAHLKDIVVLVEEAAFISRDISDSMQKYVFYEDGTYSRNKLNFSYRFIHLLKKLDWPYDDFSKVLVAINKEEFDFDKDVIKEIIRIKNLQKRFEQPLDDVLQFCLNPGGSPSKIKNLPSKLHDEIQELLKNNSSKLKKVINQIDNKLNPSWISNLCTSFTELVAGKREIRSIPQGNDNSYISFLYKTILLSKLTGISIENLIQLMLKLRVQEANKVQEINIDEVERIANINDWFNEQGFSIKNFEKIVNLIEYKTILLGKLEKVSIKELIQLMLSLNIKEINAEKVEDTVKLKDWFDEYNFSIEVFDEINNYLSQISEKVPKIKELVEKDEVVSRRDFYKAIKEHEHASVDKELDATYDFTEDYIDRKKDLESLEKTINRTEVTRVIIGNKIIFFGGKEGGNYSAKVDIYDVKKEQWEDSKASEARAAPVVAKIENKVIFFCGKKGPTEYSQQVDIYDSTTREWKKHTVSEARVRVALAEIDKKVIFFCGYNGNHYSSKIDIYDSVSGEWRKDKACEAREDSKVAVISNKKAIFFSGYNFRDPKRRSLYYQFSGRTDVYDATNPDYTKRWSSCVAKEFTQILEDYSRGTDLDIKSVVIGDKAIFFGSYQTDNSKYASVRVVYDNKDEKVYDTSKNVTAPRKNPSVAKVCNKAIFFGGRKSDSECSAKVEIYDAESGEWKITDASEPRENATVAIVCNKAIFFGGKKINDEYSAKIDIYDAKSGEWEKNVPDISGPRENAAVAVIGDRAIFFGGRKVNNQYSSEADIYDAKADKWSWHISEARINPSVAVVGDKAIFFGGEKYGGRYSSKVDTYDDETKKWKSFDIGVPLSEVEVIIEGNKANFIGKGKDNLNSIHKYAIGYPTIVEQFIKNVNTFIKIGLEKEDIENIIKHGNIFSIKKPWSTSIDQIEILLKYKWLEKKFASNTPNFLEYVKWLDSYKYEAGHVVSKISEFSKWNKETLEKIKQDKDFKACFEKKNPIDSLLKIELLISKINELSINIDASLRFKLLINMINESGSSLRSGPLSKLKDLCKGMIDNSDINADLSLKSGLLSKLKDSCKNMADESDINIVNSLLASDLMLKLKNLNNCDLKDKDKYKEYKEITTTLRSLVSLEEKEDKIVENLEEKKRDILVKFIISKYKNNNSNKIENANDLYNFLLIDVEMTGCSSISPLKAALNSMQLYIHRCMLELEKGATVNQDLTEEKWDLLDNYREWEATKRSALYPENYLNPTLRKSATAEYKELQNTLMQSNITDEAVAYAYIKYFEDFAQLINLQRVDTYFASKKLYIIGRTKAEPYIYYYRAADYSGKTDSPHKWTAWEKIEIQISVETARIIHAFGRVFVFWLQKTKKEKQIGNISIDDSTLTVHYIFKKVDGSWSAQQKLSHEINREYEHDIRKHLSDRDNHKEHIKHYKNNQEEGKEGDWDSSIKYCEGEVNRLEREIEKAVKGLKDTEFNGKLGVYLDNHTREILIVSMEEGFENSQFTLTKNLSSTREDVSLKHKNIKLKNFREVEDSIKKLYEEKCEKSVEDKKKEIQEIIAKDNNNVNNLKRNLTRLETEKSNKTQQKVTLQSKIDSIQERENKENDLQKKVEDLKKRLDDFQQQESIQDGLPKESIEKGRLQKAIDNLKQRLVKSKQIVGNKQILLTSLETEVTKLTGEDDLQKKVEDLKKRLDDFQQQESIQDGLPKESIEKGRLQKAIDNLKQRLVKSKQIVGNKQTLLTSLETEVTKLIGEIDKLAKEKTIDILKEEKNKLERENGTIAQFEGEIDKLDTKIGDKNQEVEKLNNKIESLKAEEEKYNIDGEKHREYNELSKIKQDKEIKLAEALFNQKNKDDVKSSKLEDTKTSVLINNLYRKAYAEESKIILISRGQSEEKELNFDGFYGVYLWEIFFHIPTLIAYFFNQEQEFAKARKWYQYILNPTKKGCDAWQFIPFKTKCANQDYNDKECDNSGELVDSLDFYKEADNKKTSYEKYVIKSYVDNLIDWGDMLFSQNSWEGINQATMLYVRAWDLLGSKPQKKKKPSIEAQDICELSNNKYDICKVEASIPRSVGRNAQRKPRAAVLDTTVYCNYFCTPENKEFIDLWGRIEDRLYKIRHCLDIKGKRLELPLFQPPIDPRQLVSAAARGGAIRISQAGQVPHYRFRYMINYAKSIADTVIQIGSELLSVLEKKDAEALTIFYNKQEGVMAKLITTIKEKAIEALKEEAKALNASLSSAKDRKSHYEKLIEKGWSALEISAMALSASATVVLTGAGIARQVAAGLHYIPTIFGFSNGGFQPGSSGDSIARGFELFASVAKDISQDISTSASYERRAQDWALQKTMATHDTEQISYQIEANKINQANAEQDLKAHKESIKQIKEKEEFFKSKFTSQELYSWMKGELARLYFQVYKLALEIARQTESAYRYEIDNDKAFIQLGHWNSLKQGLLAGQKLKFDLEQMDKEYHDSNERRLEITKVISLKQLDPIALHELKTKGSCRFSLIERLFDLDFPGHYARKIKDIKITIPAVVGPYENIHASLQQTSNQVILKSDGAINAIKYLLNPSEEEQPKNSLLRVNWKQNQEIAISRADQDSGLFELSFGDDRYLPFEGTGTVSSWELNLPQATNRFDVSTISDVIIHLDYTALNGGKFLSDKVKSLEQLKHYYGNLVISLSSLYPEEWIKFKQDNGKSSELVFKPSAEIFPTYTKKREIDLEKGHIYIIPKIIPKTLEDLTRVKADINGHKINFNELGKVKINTNYNLPEVGNDWKIKVSKLDISKLEEIIVIVPYKAEINWKQS